MSTTPREQPEWSPCTIGLGFHHLFQSISRRISTFRLPGADPRPGVPQEREERLVCPAPRLHLPHGRDGRLRVLAQELAPGHQGAALSKAIWQLIRLHFLLKLLYDC